jgi:Flp pilus assembly pilin Flp
VLIKLSKKSKAQTTAEYAILLGLVIAAVVAMQVYVKRAIQGRVHRSVQWMANQAASANTTIGMSNTTQYEPYYLQSDFNVTRNQNAQQNLIVGGGYNALDTSTSNRTAGYQAYSNVVQE